MIFFCHVGLLDSVMQRMQFFFLSVSVRHFLATALPDLLFYNIRKKLNDFYYVCKNNFNFRQRSSQNCQNNFITIKNFY
jgi:hypothetical protein